MIWPVIGMSAAILTMFSFVPQVIKIVRTKKSSDVSLATLLQLSCGVSLWIFYGIHLKDAIIVTANVVILITLILAISLFFKYRH
ncbi:MAG: SemiSWEET family transporter [Candidatus Omnitrophota bacterium]